MLNRDLLGIPTAIASTQRTFFSHAFETHGKKFHTVQTDEMIPPVLGKGDLDYLQFSHRYTTALIYNHGQRFFVTK